MVRQVMRISEGGRHLVCLRDDRERWNVYKIYVRWYNQGWHQKLLESYADWNSVICWLYENRRRVWE